MGWLRDFTNFVGITSPEQERTRTQSPPPPPSRTSDGGTVADEVDTIIVIGRRRRGGVLGWLERNIVDPVVDNVIEPVARFVTQDVPRFVTQDVPRIVTRDIPAAASSFATTVDQNIIQPYVAPAMDSVADMADEGLRNANAVIDNGLQMTDTLITSAFANPYTRQMLMANPAIGTAALMFGTEQGREQTGIHARAIGYGILHDALGQGLPALAGAAVDVVTGVSETQMDIYGGLWRAATTNDSLEDIAGSIRPPWHRLTGNANDSFMQTWEKWGDENLGEWLTWPVGLADVEYRTSRDSFWDVEVSTDGERSWNSVGRSEQGALIVGNILDPTNLVGIGIANRVIDVGMIGKNILSRSDTLTDLYNGTMRLGNDFTRITAPVVTTMTNITDMAMRPLQYAALRADEITAPLQTRISSLYDTAARGVDDFTDSLDTLTAPLRTRISGMYRGVADPVSNFGTRVGTQIMDTPYLGTALRVSGGTAMSVLRDPYSMSELSAYAVAIGGPVIRDQFFPHEAIGDFYSMLTDPNSLDGPDGERRLIDTLNIIYARGATNLSDREANVDRELVRGHSNVLHYERLRALDRDAGLSADTGVFSAFGHDGIDRTDEAADTAISRSRFIGLELDDYATGVSEGQRPEINVSTRGQELGLQIAFDGLVQRYMANPNMPMTRSETLLAQVMLAREGMGGGTLDQAATKQSLGQYVEETGLTPALIEARRNGSINERANMSRAERDAALQPPPQQPGLAGPAVTP